jgi:hypothetical protein
MDPSEDALPPADVRLVELRVEPWPDSRRIRVHVALTPFAQDPNLDALLFDADENEVAQAAIIENAAERFVFTLHLRAPRFESAYRLDLTVSYPDLGVVDTQSTRFTLPPPAKLEA